MDLYKYIDSKLESLNFEKTGFVDFSKIKIIYKEIYVEKNRSGLKSIDNIKREIIEDDEDQTAHNPYLEGQDIRDLSNFFENYDN